MHVNLVIFYGTCIFTISVNVLHKNTIVWKKVYFSLHDINADEAFGEDQT